MALALVEFDAAGFRKRGGIYELVLMRDGVVIFVGPMPSDLDPDHGDMMIMTGLQGIFPVEVDDSQENVQ